MMVLASGSRLLRLSCIALAWPLLSASSAPQVPQPVTFPHKNYSDLRGILNVFAAFRQACLAQPVTPDLPEQLLPEGYRIVSPGFHLLGMETGTAQKAVILSKTGEEESDFAGGYPYIELGFPTHAAPGGECRVVWQRAWDYPDGVKDIMVDTAILMDGWLSFYLKAIRVSRPEDGFAVADQYGLVSDWSTQCWDGNWCDIDVLVQLNIEDGIHIAIRRGEEPPVPGGGRN